MHQPFSTTHVPWRARLHKRRDRHEGRLHPDYIAAICYLLDHGEERLLVAVERGVMPANIAMEIARAPDRDVQQTLAEAYENKLLPGNQILAIRLIILQRNQRRKKPHRGRGAPRTGKVTAESLIKSYQHEAQRQKLLVRRPIWRRPG
jgi:ParB family chromosome partitioning protein